MYNYNFDKMLIAMAHIGSAYMSILPQAKDVKTKEESDKLVDEALDVLKRGFDMILEMMKEQVRLG